MREYRYTTPHGIEVTRTVSKAGFRRGLTHLLRDLDRHRGIYLSSGYEYPGRYSRWISRRLPAARDRFLQPPRGVPPAQRARPEILQMLHPVLAEHPHWEDSGFRTPRWRPPQAAARPVPGRGAQQAALGVLHPARAHRRVSGRAEFAPRPGGAFGYDLLFQFEPIDKKLPRDGHKDLHLFLCDDIWFMDRKKEQVERYQYDFARQAVSTRGLPRDGAKIAPPPGARPVPGLRPHARGVHGRSRDRARRHAPRRLLRSGVAADLQYAVFGQGVGAVSNACSAPAPARTSSCCNSRGATGGASPEMFVRAEGPLIETSPIAGTAQRTGDPLRDADNIRELLKSVKDESELTMCTDVDRNDKSRVCEPGSVRVVGRRLIESYAGVFHTTTTCRARLSRASTRWTVSQHMWA